MGGLLLPAVLAGTAVGILAADMLPAAGAAGPALLVASALLLGGAALVRRAILLVAAAALLGALLGSWRGEASELPVGPGSVGALIGASELVISATVSEEPRPRGERQQVVLDELSIAAGGAERRAAGRVLLWLPRAALVAAGDRVRFSAALEEPRDFDGFAYRAYLARQGIGATASAFEITVVGNRRGWLPGVLDGLRHALERGLNDVIPEPEAALADGILLGVRTGIAPDVGDAFQRAGLTHVVAISGWNIAIVAALAAAATRPLQRLRGGRWLALVTACVAVAGYVLLTGASPSVVRAALMAGGLVLARTQGSRAHAMSALALAALVMLIAAPPVLWDVGFQLSGLATAGLIWFGAGLESRLRHWPALLREPVALTMAAQLTTLPVILLNFERLSLVAPAANVVVVPLVPIVMLCGALGAVVGAADAAFHVPIIGDLACWLAGGSAWLYLRLMILAGQAAAAVPLASVDLGAPAWLAAAWYPGLWLLRGRLTHVTEPPQRELAVRPLRPYRAVGLTVAVLAVLTAVSRPDGRLHLWMLDVGQGDAIVVRGPSGATALVDGGPDPELVLRRLGAVLPFWQRDLRLVVMTHPHEDHVAGLIGVLERFRVSLVLDPGRPYDNPSYPRFVAAAAAEPGGSYELARAGQIVPLDAGTRMVILYPSEADAAAPLPDDDINNASVVALLEHPALRALLTGDAEAPVEERLLARGVIGPVDVLKVAHHGSDSGTTLPFLAALRPRIALISAGAGNEYGHPHRSTLEHLEAMGVAEVHRTDLEGSVEIVVDELRITASGERTTDAGSIGPWPSRPARRPRRSWRRTACRRACCVTCGESPGWPRRPRASWMPPACRWTWSSSRPPPCCTTSTSWRRAGTAGSTAWWPRSGWPRWAMRSSRRSSRRIP